MLCSSELFLDYYPNFLTAKEAVFHFEALVKHAYWQHEYYRMFGRQIQSPRLVSWYGDHRAVYQYSGIKHHPRPWNKVLSQLRHQVELKTQAKFNSVLLNHYRNGLDNMGWHADNEKELGANPIIASISLGANRILKFRENNSKKTSALLLENGSLLVMYGSTQTHFKHALPKSKKITEPRINLTFRFIYH